MANFFRNLKAKIFTKADNFSNKLDYRVSAVIWLVIVVAVLVGLFFLFIFLLNKGII